MPTARTLPGARVAAQLGGLGEFSGGICQRSRRRFDPLGPCTRIMTVGTRFPAYATSMGRVLVAALPPAQLEDYLTGADIRPLTPHASGTREGLLAELATVRTQGWCLLNQELERGLMSVAAPVHDGAKVVAAINVSLQAQSVAARPDPEAYLDSVRTATVATAGLSSADLSSGH